MIIQDKINKLRSVETIVLNGVTKIYFLEVTQHPGLVKIGDTHREVKDRNNETILNSGLILTRPVTWIVAEKFDGSSFRDKSFHKFLEKKKYKRHLNNNGRPSEWFYITLEQALYEFSEFTKKPVQIAVDFRNAQTYLLNEQQKAYDEGYRYFNLGYCVRVGKTIISLEFARRNNLMPVYIGKNLNSQNSAETDNNKFGLVPSMLTQSIHGDIGEDDIGEDEVPTKIKQIIHNINEENKNNQKIIVFIDEVDDASWTPNSRKVIFPVVEYLKQQGMFGCIHTMSGTRVYRGMHVLKELVADESEIKEISLEYYEMQILQPDTTVNRNLRTVDFYAKDASGVVNISDAMKDYKTGHASLATFFKEMLGSNNFSLVETKPAWFIKIKTDAKKHINEFANYLNNNCKKIEGVEHIFKPINGDFTNNKDAEKYCEKIIAKNPHKVVVFITQGMATTSFSVPAIGNSAIFTDSPLTSDDIQALHRSATYITGKTDCNMLIVSSNDNTEPDYEDVLEYEIREATTREDKEKVYKEILEKDSIIHLVRNPNGNRVPINVTIENVSKILDKKSKAMTKVANLMIAIDEHTEEDVLNSILGYNFNTTRKNTNSKTDKPEAFDPFGDKGTNNSTKTPSVEVNGKQKEKILRAFVENAVLVPAYAQEQRTTLEDFEFWNEVGIDKELFFTVYNANLQFKDRIDSIYNLCDDVNYRIETYIDKLAASNKLTSIQLDSIL